MYSPHPHPGAVGALISIGLFGLFGSASMLVPLFVAFMATFAFLPLRRETAIALACCSWAYFILADAWLGSGFIGYGIAALIEAVACGEADASRWVVGAIYTTTTALLLGSTLLGGARRVVAYRLPPLRRRVSP
jgi:hypothetical protein